jgi:hypothetical protein
MDLSIIKEAFALRDAARALQREAGTTDQAATSRGLTADVAAQDKSSALDERALALMQRAAALKLESAKLQQANAQPTGARALALLTAASAPLDTGGGSGPPTNLGGGRGRKPKAPVRSPPAAPARTVRPMRRGK